MLLDVEPYILRSDGLLGVLGILKGPLLRDFRVKCIGEKCYLVTGTNSKAYMSPLPLSMFDDGVCKAPSLA